VTSTSLSTYVSYLIVNRDMKSSLSKVASESTVARDTAYYEANIGNVTSVEEFTDDYQIFSYAMKAFGLEDMTYAKAFMKKVLESDLTDDSSFANTLTDKRYAAFASAYNFNGGTAVAQTSVQQSTLVEAYQASYDAEEKSISTEVDYYNSKIGSVTNVDDLLNDSRLRAYVLDSYGLDSTYTSKSFLKSVLTSDLDDPDSFANTSSNATFQALAGDFNFSSDGSVDGDAAQTDAQVKAREVDYIYNKSTFPSDLLAEANQTYFDTKMASVTNVSEVIADSRMVDYLKTAFDISVTFNSTIGDILKSDPDNDNSAAALLGYQNVAALFNFQTDGTLADGDVPQDADQMATTAVAYTANFSLGQEDAVTEAVTNYQTRIAEVKSIDDFLTSNADDDDTDNDDVTEIWDVSLRAYGIDPDEVSQSKLRKILASDTSDPDSYVNTLDDERYVNLVNAFNFSTDGEVEVPLQIQSESIVNNLVSDYKAQQQLFLTGTEKTTAGEKADTEIEYYKTQMATITTLDAFLADDRLVAVALQSKGIDPESVTAEDLKDMFESDLDDPDSFVNSQEDSAFAELVASFNFDADGVLTADTLGTVQQRGDVLATINKYMEQTLEEEQGDANAGVRLALYFQRNAADVTSAYTILGDSALFEFFTTAYSLSDYISNMDVEQQASMVENFIDIEKLQDPDYVNELVQRFTALYDVENSVTTSAALTILSGSSTTNISADTLLAVAQLSSK
jgi:hypothetical protein